MAPGIRSVIRSAVGLLVAACGAGSDPTGIDVGYVIEGRWDYSAELAFTPSTRVERCRIIGMRIDFTTGKPPAGLGTTPLHGVARGGSLECFVFGTTSAASLAGTTITGGLGLLGYSFEFSVDLPELGRVEVSSSWAQGVDPPGNDLLREGRAELTWVERAADQTPVPMWVSGHWQMSKM